MLWLLVWGVVLILSLICGPQVERQRPEADSAAAEKRLSRGRMPSAGCGDGEAWRFFSLYRRLPYTIPDELKPKISYKRGRQEPNVLVAIYPSAILLELKANLLARPEIC